MADLDNDDRVPNGNVTQLTGTLANDSITLSGTFLLPNTTSGSIDGLGGDDTLNLNGGDLSNTTINSIEFTVIRETFTQNIDAAQIANLGTLSIGGNADGIGATIRLTNGAGQTADFSNLMLDGTEEPAVVTLGLSNGDSITVDFSGATFGGTSFVDYDGDLALDIDDDVTGGSGNDQLSGGNGDDTLRGGGGNDVLSGDTGVNSVFGDAGNDEITTFNTSSGIIDGGDDNDILNVNGAFVASTIAGGAGIDDLLNLATNDLSGTVISGVERTSINSVFRHTIDHDQIANLGDVTFGGSAAGASTLISINDGSGQSVGFSNFTLADGETLRVEAVGLTGSDMISVDLSGATYAATASAKYEGGAGQENVQGGRGMTSCLVRMVTTP